MFFLEHFADLTLLMVSCQYIKSELITYFGMIVVIYHISYRFDCRLLLDQYLINSSTNYFYIILMVISICLIIMLINIS